MYICIHIYIQTHVYTHTYSYIFIYTYSYQQDAMFAYEAALAPGRIGFLKDKDAAMVHNNLGLLYKSKQNRHDDAEAQYRLSCTASEKAGVSYILHI